MAGTTNNRVPVSQGSVLRLFGPPVEARSPSQNADAFGGFRASSAFASLRLRVRAPAQSAGTDPNHTGGYYEAPVRPCGAVFHCGILLRTGSTLFSRRWMGDAV